MSNHEDYRMPSALKHVESETTSPGPLPPIPAPTQPAATPRETPTQQETAFNIAQTFYGYFEGDSAGSHEAMLYFKNYAATDMAMSLVERASNHLSPIYAALTAARREAEGLRRALEEIRSRLPAQQYVQDGLTARELKNIIAFVDATLAPTTGGKA